MFGAVAFYKALQGETSCGCFGDAIVHPWYSFALDVSIVVLLVAFLPAQLNRRQQESAKPTGPPAWNRLASSLCIACFGWICIHFASPIMRPLTLRYAPGEWVGNALPLIEDIDIGKAFTSGNWLVVVFRHDCPACQTVLDQLREPNMQLPPEYHLALVSVPPHDRDELDELQRSSTLVGTVSNQYEWDFPTPMIVALVDGKVMAVGEQLDTIDDLGDTLQRELSTPGTEASRVTLADQLAIASVASNDCGVQCLYLASSLLAGTKDFAWFREQAVVSEAGVSLLDLKRLAARAGLTADAVRTSLSGIEAHLTGPRRAVVLHVNGAHYVAILRFKDGLVQVFDPSIGIDELATFEFSDRYSWAGVALLLNNPDREVDTT
ncbi:MAG: hypothetical protein H8E66_32100 [Planctomycetes bacterium]|nr:hypothetical protein [Planctomycetota bacterium]